MRTRLLIISFVACASSPTIPPVRFANAPPVEEVNDRRNIPKPEEREFVRYLHHYDGWIHRPIVRALDLQRPLRALGVNALDEVPDSTWFTNRIGRREVTPAEICAAPDGGVGTPEPHVPWTILSTKIGGLSVGFMIKDARGEKFLLKFDLRGYPELETGAHVIAGKLLWAAGYNVTDDYVVYVRREDLKLAPDATMKDAFGNTRALDNDELERKLARIEIDPDGRIRGLASHILAGKPIGGYPSEGVRADDPNDRIPHEHRRDLRGAYTLFSWLDHNDLQEGNLLDMWVEDPADPNRHYVKHYLLDYGDSLGALATRKRDKRQAYEYHLDFPSTLGALFTAGAFERPWEHRNSPALRGVGLFHPDNFDPGAWKAGTQVYVPMLMADAVDKFWGAKLLIRFTREHIRAAVAAARYSDPLAAEYITETLIARQRKIAKYWFERVNPLDEFAFANGRLCFADLSIVHQFARATTTQYTLSSYDANGQPISLHAVVGADAGGRTCGTPMLARNGNGYTIVRVDTARPGFTGTTYIHIARDPNAQTPRVIGIWRP